MITTILAASLLSSIPQAIDYTNSQKCFGIKNPEQFQLCVEDRLMALEQTVKDHERIAVNTWKCFNGALVGGGMDLGTTALALADHPTEVKEANPLGFNVESRVALKFAQVGITGWGCYILEKTGHSKMASIASKSSLLAQLGFAANNFIRTLILDRKSRKSGPDAR